MTRISHLTHRATGVTEQTPLLIPSFSSRGFAQGKSPQDSEVMKWLTLASDFLDRPYLVSAYDIHEGFVPPPEGLPYKPNILFVDSGGYEISQFDDLSAAKIAPPGLAEWTHEKLITIQSSWPESQPAVFVSYDHPDQTLSFSDQLDRAKEDARRMNAHLNTFLIKPSTKAANLAKVLNEAIVRADELRGFDIVGVTEKEIGNSMFDRMKNIAKLRRALDEAQVNAPIHVFGSLDPLSTCLYFVAGAEIFDGLTWLRYAYSEDHRCVYIHNEGPLKYGVEEKDQLVRAKITSDNFNKLRSIERALRDYAVDDRIDELPHAQFMTTAKRKLENVLKKG